MDLKVRTTRTIKVTELELTAEQMEQLAQLALDPRYQALLDVMERACIALDTGLINLSVGDPEAVLGGHCVSKAGWLFFTYVQRQVQVAYNAKTNADVEEPRPSLEEMLQGVEG